MSHRSFASEIRRPLVIKMKTNSSIAGRLPMSIQESREKPKRKVVSYSARNEPTAYLCVRACSPMAARASSRADGNAPDPADGSLRQTLKGGIGYRPAQVTAVEDESAVLPSILPCRPKAPANDHCTDQSLFQGSCLISGRRTCCQGRPGRLSWP